MSDISIVEWGVYGFVAYSSLLMLIISVIKEVPMTKSLSIVRAIYLIPGMICAGLLSGSGVNIITNLTTTTTRNVNTTEVWTETINQQIPLQNDVWILVHLMIFLVLFFYVVQHLLILFTKHDSGKS